jgi:hypothetical protein
VLPEVMRREGFDLWIVVAREYNEDPVLMSLLPAPMMSARRRTILVFHAPGAADGVIAGGEGEFEALAIANAGIGLDGYYRPMWDKSRTAQASEDQWACLRRVVAERDPRRIGIDVAEHFAFGDGLSHHEHDALRAALGEDLWARTASAERLAVGWLERRSAGRDRRRRRHQPDRPRHHRRGLLQPGVHPGVTTAVDVAWWLRQRAADLGLVCWFQPTVSIQRRGVHVGDIGSSPDEVIRPGDLLHCDFGLHYLGLATDTQQNAYVLRLGEEAPPAGLALALVAANRQQDLLAAEMVAGAAATRSWPPCARRWRPRVSRGACTPTRSASTATGRGRSSASTTSRTAFPAAATCRCTTTPCTPSRCSSRSPVAGVGRAAHQAGQRADRGLHGRPVHFLGGRQTALHLIH